MGPLTAGQLLAIEVSTRVSSVASILGSLFIVSTFVCFLYFREPIKPTARLILYTTLGNIITNGATLISVSAISHEPTKITPLCKAQAFLIQWFMLADPFWAGAFVSLNVSLVVFKRFDSPELLPLEKWYVLFAYGLPALTAIIYFIHDYNSEQHIMGPTTLWCWVTKEFDWLRIVFSYAPVWVLAGMTMSIYICVGARVYKRQLTMKELTRRSRQISAAASGVLVTTEVEHDVDNNAQARTTTPDVDLKSEYSWVPVFRPTEHAAHIKRSKENVVALAYFRSGLLMFVALLVVWGPSSINRLYQIAHPENPSYGLNLASALVLPMQGLWNAIIFASSTWPECKRAHRTIMLKLIGDALSKHPSNDSMQDMSVKYTGDIECGDTGVSSEEKFEPNSSTQRV
ncbi:hypothetical protein EJ07DRAFT_92595 [Lizonia empirigonia]|nr:hypothetical protein EJ07DRAFT_92595 [Lizonia empirigonia]